MSAFASFKTWIAGSVAALALTAPALADPSLWHLSDEDSDIYIFGTVHILRPDVEWRAPAVMAAFESADTVWFEAPVNDPAEQANMMPLLQRYGLNPPERPLSSQISDEANAALAELSPLLGTSPAALEPLRPWLASVQITVGYAVIEGFDPTSGVEAQLWPEAVGAGKDLQYFETVEEQLQFFANLDREIEVELLEQTLAQIDEAPDTLDGLVTAWANGDQATIDRLMNGDFRDDSPEVYDVLIAQRNAHWADVVEDMMAGSGTVFIAVGAGHLPGEGGLIDLLEDRGFTVTQE
ncbi:MULTISPECIES: TraB/GumN family protein [Hyphobacterium]|uniref:TraB/GumN family protein n=1 Tax=Hyphobacterium vulgare TaxID=1736751 RepID=A0ABV6ZWY1_9PROT